MTEPEYKVLDACESACLHLMYSIYGYRHAKSLQDRADACDDIGTKVIELEQAVSDMEDSLIIRKDIAAKKQRISELRERSE